MKPISESCTNDQILNTKRILVKLDRFSTLMAKFWWGSKGQDKKIHWLKWDKLSEKKHDGGMGFKDLRCHDLAMLANQEWRLMSGGDFLLRKVLKAKYYPNGHFMQAVYQRGMLHGLGRVSWRDGGFLRRELGGGWAMGKVSRQQKILGFLGMGV